MPDEERIKVRKKLIWWKKKMLRDMDSVQETITDFYEEVFSMGMTLSYLEEDLSKARRTRSHYFDMLDKAEEEGVKVDDIRLWDGKTFLVP